ncbi:MAG TPA: hypothetical protein VF533_01430 [Solirubrobacteraceae bacterium]
MAARLIVLDDGLGPALADELSARGRPATTVAALGLAGAGDADVLAAVAARDGVLVALHPLGVRTLAAPVAHVVAREAAARRDAVHRHAAAIAAQRRGLRRYR